MKILKVTVLALVAITLVYVGMKMVKVENYKINLVWVVGDQVNWLNLDAKEKKATIFEIPENMMMGVVNMKGEIRSGALWKFGENEHKPLIITKRSTELMFGAIADGVIYQKNKGNFLFGVKSDLSFLDRLTIWFKYKKLAKDQIETVKIPQTLGVVEKLPDGSEVIRLDRQRLDLVIDGILVEEAVLKSTTRVIIVNRSGVEGMSKLAERQIKNVGGLVVEVKEGSVSDGWCHFGSDKKTLNENQGLTSWFEEKMKCKKEVYSEERKGEIEVNIDKDWGGVYKRE